MRADRPTAYAAVGAEPSCHLPNLRTANAREAFHRHRAVNMGRRQHGLRQDFLDRVGVQEAVDGIQREAVLLRQ